jgi:hypothetical protein
LYDLLNIETDRGMELPPETPLIVTLSVSATSFLFTAFFVPYFRSWNAQREIQLTARMERQRLESEAKILAQKTESERQLAVLKADITNSTANAATLARMGDIMIQLVAANGTQVSRMTDVTARVVDNSDRLSKVEGRLEEQERQIKKEFSNLHDLFGGEIRGALEDVKAWVEDARSDHAKLDAKLTILEQVMRGILDQLNSPTPNKQVDSAS